MRLPAMVVVVLFAAHVAVSSAAQAPPPSPIFTFEADEFWLNLHHFLHVLGRAQAKTPDASRSAVAGAPPKAALVQGTTSVVTV
jgi:hypothetical protein